MSKPFNQFAWKNWLNFLLISGQYQKIDPTVRKERKKKFGYGRRKRQADLTIDEQDIEQKQEKDSTFHAFHRC